MTGVVSTAKIGGRTTTGNLLMGDETLLGHTVEEHLEMLALACIFSTRARCELIQFQGELLSDILLWEGDVC
jgi:hypothetical protein